MTIKKDSLNESFAVMHFWFLQWLSNKGDGYIQSCEHSESSVNGSLHGSMVLPCDGYLKNFLKRGSVFGTTYLLSEHSELL